MTLQVEIKTKANNKQNEIIPILLKNGQLQKSGQTSDLVNQGPETLSSHQP